MYMYLSVSQNEWFSKLFNGKGVMRFVMPQIN